MSAIGFSARYYENQSPSETLIKYVPIQGQPLSKSCYAHGARIVSASMGRIFHSKTLSVVFHIAAGVIFGLLLEWAISLVTGRPYYFILLPAVLWVARQKGFAASMATILLGTLITNYFFFNNYKIEISFSNFVMMFLFAVFAGISAWLLTALSEKDALATAAEFNRLKTERELEESRMQLSFALESAQMGPWHINLVTNQVVVSPNASAIFGVDQIKGDIFEEINQHMHPDDQAEVNRTWMAAVSERRAYAHEYRIIKPDGQIRWLLSRGRATYADDGSPLTFAGIVMDITDRKNNEFALRIAKETAERANQLKSSFLANMSHEIRTPLGAMLGFANLLKDPSASEEERQSYAEILNRNGIQLSRVIDDILDLSKVEAGHLDLVFEAVDVREVISEMISLFSVTAQEKGLSLIAEIDLSTPDELTTDPTRVRQILSNIVGNAIKFTHAGQITVRSFGVDGSTGQKGLRFEIEDTGLGIPEDSTEQLFKIFSQVDVTMTRRYGGTGLGLALSKRLANLLGGDLTLSRTSLGQGSTFEIKIFEKAGNSAKKSFQKILDTPSRKTMVKDSLKGFSILVADDSPDNQELIKQLLTRQGAVVELVGNGEEAIAAAEKGEHDMILMDLQMPLMDGFTATRTLRANGYKKPIIALTAHAMIEVQKDCLSAGCDAHLSKPIQIDHLVETLLRCKPAARTQTAAVGSSVIAIADRRI